MAKRAFFLLVLEMKTFLSAFKLGLDERDMDVYWRSGHSDRFLLQTWCLERPFSRGYGCACLVWSSLILLALWRWFCWSFASGMERNMRSFPFCTTQLTLSASVYSSNTYDYLGTLWEILRVNVATLLVKEWMTWMCFYMYSTAKSALLCHLSHLYYTWVALLLRRPFLAIESCFVHLWRNQVVDHFKLKSRDGVFGWKFIKDFPSSHIHKWKRFGPGLFWCITIFFFEVTRCLLVQCTGSLLLLFFSTSVSLY